jgi:RimJ/RimL family protein N-acetyltransferase
MLRTPFPLTQEQQAKFYSDVICNKQANAKYWAITDLYHPGCEMLIGMCGLENIQWENRLAEISMVLNPEYPLEKYGEEALQLLLHEGFMNMNLENIFAEVYECNPYIAFWLSMYNKYNGIKPAILLPNRKYFNGQYYDSAYINFNKGAIKE